MKINQIFQILIQVLLFLMARAAPGKSEKSNGSTQIPGTSAHRRSSKSGWVYPLLAVFIALPIFVRKITAVNQDDSQKRSPAGELDQETRNDDPPPGKKEPPIIHPILFAFFPAISLVSDNLELLTFDRKLRALTLGLIGGNTLSYLSLRTLLKDRAKAGAIVSASTLLFSTYGHAFDFLTGSLKLKLNHRSLLAAWGLLEAGAVCFIMKHTNHYVTEALNLLAASLVGLSLSQTLIARVKEEEDLPGPGLSIQMSATTSASSVQRDIYYLVVDAHASPSTLKEIYLEDDLEFIQKLRAKGFFIAEQSHSNYAMTMLSLASSLNLSYLPPSYLHAMNGGPGIKLAAKWIEDNVSMRFLKSQGYETIFIGSGFGITQRNRQADLDLQGSAVDESLGRFIQSTLVRPFADWLHLIANDKRRRILKAFELLGELPDREGPKFVFAHIASPQWPFLFEANGAPTNRREFDLEQKKKAYLDQVRYIDKKLDCLLEQILKTSSVEPIIVIQADHGPNFGFARGYDLQHPPLEILYEKMRILNAFYLPGMEYDSLYPGITPVNTFRLIFNQYFSADIPLLKDEIYYSTLAFPHRVNDVSALVAVR